MDDTTPRYLYHGTKGEHVAQIFEEGLQPRELTETSNWGETDFPSIEGHVYLTRDNALHFADAATDSGEELGVIEVDLHHLDEENLYPDEDFIEQALRGRELSMGLDEVVEVPEGVTVSSDADVVERTRQVREAIDEFWHYWEISLKVMGSVSHRGTIPTTAITRASVGTLGRSFRLTVMEDAPSIASGVFHSEKKEMVTDWVMGSDVDPGDVARATIPVDELPPGVEEQFERTFEDSSFELRENPNYDGD